MTKCCQLAAAAAAHSCHVVLYSPPVDCTALSIVSLLDRCVEQDHADAWEEFVRRFQRTIAGAVCKALRSYGTFDPTLVEDLVQDSFVRLCRDHFRSLRQFQAVDEECFYGLLRATAISAVCDHLRRRLAIKRRADASPGTLETVLLEAVAGRATEEVYHDSITLQRIDELLQAATPPHTERNRFVFWMHYRDGFSAAEIARLPSVGLTAKGVETLLRRLMNDLKTGGLVAGHGGVDPL